MALFVATKLWKKVKNVIAGLMTKNAKKNVAIQGKALRCLQKKVNRSGVKENPTLIAHLVKVLVATKVADLLRNWRASSVKTKMIVLLRPTVMGVKLNARSLSINRIM